MRTPGENVDQVHVLRQKFRLNDPLRGVFAEFMKKPEPESQPTEKPQSEAQGKKQSVVKLAGIEGSIYSTEERQLEIPDTLGQDFKNQLGEADEYLRLMANTHLLLGRVSATALMRDHDVVELRFLMKPQNAAEFASISDALDFIEAGRRVQAPDIGETGLYTVIPRERLRPLSEVSERLAELNHALGSVALRRQYQVTPLPKLLGKSFPRASRELVKADEDVSEDVDYSDSRAS